MRGTYATVLPSAREAVRESLEKQGPALAAVRVIATRMGNGDTGENR